MKYLFIVFASLSFVKCSYPQKLDNCFSSLMDSINSAKEATVIDFRQFNCKEWDSLLIIQVEFSKRCIEKEMQIILPKDIIQDFESPYQYFVFLKNNKIVGYFPISRLQVDLDPLISTLPNRRNAYALIPNEKLVMSFFYKDEVWSGTNKRIFAASLVK